jgi:circadian clock protein KaiC
MTLHRGEIKVETTQRATHSFCSTGITGLDHIMLGGFPKNRLFLIQGDPGVGKTTLALQFLMEGVRNGEKSLYITLSETKEELEAVAKSHGWNLSDIAIVEISAIEQQLMADSHNTLFPPSEVELNKTIKLLLNEIEKVNPSRVVFDSVSEIRLLAQEAFRYRRQILSLKQYFAGRHCTVLLLDDKSEENADAQVKSIAHGVVTLEAVAPEYGIDRRRIKILKLRGVPFRGGYHDYVIKKGGIVVFPRLIAAEHSIDFKAESVVSGIKEMDALVGGGLDRGTSNLFIGPSGCGKSTLALAYASAAADRGEHVLFYLFDETKGTLLKRAKALGLNFEKHIKSGKIDFTHVDPAELSPGEFVQQIHNSVQNNKTRMVVIDSLNGYLNAMPEEKFLTLQLHELLTYLNQQGVVSLMVMTQHGILSAEMTTTIDLSYLADTVILMRYFEFSGTIKKAVSVVKKRSGQHESTIREFKVASNGIMVGEPLTDFHGIFKGVPSYRGAKEAILDNA